MAERSVWPLFFTIIISSTYVRSRTLAKHSMLVVLPTRNILREECLAPEGTAVGAAEAGAKAPRQPW